MKGFFKTMFAGMIGSFIAIFLFIIIAIIVIVSVVYSSNKEVIVKEKTILHLRFKDPVSDNSSININKLNISFDKKLGIRNVTESLKKAKSDENIKGIWLELGDMPSGMAIVQEIRDAIKDFKTSGKFVVASSNFYTHKTYYLASVADKIYLTPEGEVQFMGLSANIMFFKSMLEKLGVEPEVIRHGKFKSAVEPFITNEISKANHQQTLKYLSSMWETIVEGVSEEREISVSDLNMYADSMYISSSNSAKKYNFVDNLLYKDQVLAELKRLTETEKDKKINTLSLSEYDAAKKIEEVDDDEEYSTDKIAVIYAIGEIGMGEGGKDKIGFSLAKQIREARKDTSVKAIVLRVNSPGGSALASEVIWRETVLAKKAKPFIVSMGNVAASGGYYISCYADTIVAEPNTITGSIGVFGLMFNTKKIMDKVGISVNTVKTNKYSDLGNKGRKMTAYERNVIQQGVDSIYTTFITHVANGRGLTVAEVDSIGQGRVWAGKDAKEIGLVDVFGGLETAIDIAAKKINKENYRLKIYPKRDKMDIMIESFLADSKTSILEEELGVSYKYFKMMKDVQEIKGVQARLPYYLEVE